MDKYGIDSEHVRHYDVTRKALCPAPLVDENHGWTLKGNLIVQKRLKDLKVALDLLVEKGIVTEQRLLGKGSFNYKKCRPFND